MLLLAAVDPVELVEEVLWAARDDEAVEEVGTRVIPLLLERAAAELEETTGGVPAVEPVLAEAEVLLPAAPRTGAGVALEGSTKAPVPQGIASPPGCVAFSGSTVLPVASAIVKRVVHVMLVVEGSVNW